MFFEFKDMEGGRRKKLKEGKNKCFRTLNGTEKRSHKRGYAMMIIDLDLVSKLMVCSKLLIKEICYN